MRDSSSEAEILNCPRSSFRFALQSPFLQEPIDWLRMPSFALHTNKKDNLGREKGCQCIGLTSRETRPEQRGFQARNRGSFAGGSSKGGTGALRFEAGRVELQRVRIRRILVFQRRRPDTAPLLSRAQDAGLLAEPTQGGVQG